MANQDWHDSWVGPIGAAKDAATTDEKMLQAVHGSDVVGAPSTPDNGPYVTVVIILAVAVIAVILFNILM